MNIIDIIEKKKKGLRLSTEEIYYFIDRVTNKSLPDYQTSALLMAICLKGMDRKETTDLAMAMAYSGDVIDMSWVGKTVLDKHSTGGVGDKTTLIVGPVMASLGVPVGKMSGRGLGITGGTIDKLDAIPGFGSDLSDEMFMECLKKNGFVDAAQTKNLAPADKILYALRDVTGTVDSIPLIASSIMSKKLASGANAIVLDVKCGNGAFMTDYDSAKLLAETMIDIGNLAGRKCSAVISDMNQPLGYTVGNLLEVKEAVDFLRGKIIDERLWELVIAICTKMYILSGIPEKDSAKNGENIDEYAERHVKDNILNGKAYASFLRFVSGQGGYSSFIENELSNEYEDIIPPTVYSSYFLAEKDGYIQEIFADVTGKASMLLGAGRIELDDVIDQYAGIYLNKKVGEFVHRGDVVARLYSSDKEKLKCGLDIFKDAVVYNDSEAALLNDIVIQRFN